MSGSDAKRGLGAKSANGCSRHGDAFELYVHFEHGGDISAALEAWKAECDDNRRFEVGEGLARRSEGLATQHNRLRALGRTPAAVKNSDTDDILKTLRRLGRRGAGGTRK